jgi:virulence factor Mce-like protein
MKRTGNAASVVSNPVLVGAVTILVTIVAVVLSYNANKGLPFVPTTELKVDAPNGAELVPGNEVRSGGKRVGVVEDMRPVRLPDGSTVAQLTLKLDQQLGPVPRDSTFRIRPRSALGLKYVELTEGRSRQAFQNGDTVPPSQASFGTDLDTVFSMFDARTRKAIQTDLQGFGDAFVGRGAALGRTIEELPPLFRHLQPVMSTLAAPPTELPRFWQELGDFMRVVAPVAHTNAALFTSMKTTFDALSQDPAALKAFISKSPPTMDTAISSFRAQRPFLNDLAAFGRDFGPATADLRAALPTLNSALEVGTPVQRRAVALDRRLTDLLAAVQDLAEAPATRPALRGVQATVGTLNPQMRFYGPFVTVCNSFNVFFTYLAEHFSQPDSTGSAQRALANFAGIQKNSEGAMGATEPANGEQVLTGNPQFAQNQPYGAAITPDGRADCEAGQRGYLRRQARFFDPRFHIALDPRTPGAQGRTFTGLPRVPRGETFTSRPQTGPYRHMLASEFGGR